MMLNSINWKKEIMDKQAEVNMLILFEEKKCEECRHGITELSRLAKIEVEDINLPAVALVHCEDDERFCEVWTGRFDHGTIDEPFMLYIKDRKVYVYKGPIEAEKIQLWL